VPTGSGFPIPDEGALVDIGDGRLWCRSVGSGPGTVVVLTTGNADELADLIVPGHRVVFADARGRGRSDPVADPAGGGLAAAVDDLEALRAALGVERFAGLGWSWLSGVLATYALRYPDRVERLVLVSPVPCHAGRHPAPGRAPAPHQLAHLDQLDAAGLRASDPVAYCRAWRAVYAPLLLADPAAADRLADVCDQPNEWPWVVARGLVPVYAELLRHDWRPWIGEVQTPVLVVHGEQDEPVEAATEWVDALPEGRLLPVPGSGALPWIDRPDVFFPTVNRFLAGAPV
jgi:proline iminopeptidase